MIRFPLSHLAWVCLVIGLLGALSGCGKTLADESAVVSGDAYWTQNFHLSNNGSVSINLTSDQGVDCLLMKDRDYRDFLSARNLASISGGMYHFRYLEDLSQMNATRISKSANLASGDWVVVVMKGHTGTSPGAGVANFNIKIGGPPTSSKGTSSSGGTPESAMNPSNGPSAAPEPRQPPQASAPPRPVPPPPPPLKTTFANLDEALTTLTNGQMPERRAALSYLAGQEVVASKRVAVMAILVPMLQDPQYHREAHPLVLRWASKEDAARLQEALQAILARNSVTMDAASARDAVALAKLLQSYGDEKAIDALLQLMRAPGAQDAARAALTDCGSAAEPALLAALTKSADGFAARDAQVKMEYLALLGAVGTDKSVEPLQAVATAKDAAQAKAAADALTALAERLKLKPEQYLYNLINRYAVEAPVGFTADPTMTQPNTRRWTRQAPNRSVKSTYTVQVTRVDANYQLASTASGNPTQVGTLVFRPQALPQVPQFTQGAHVAALDGVYLIDVVAVADTADRTAQGNMTNALKTIKGK